MSTQTIHGIGASAGIAIGPVFRYETREQRIEERHVEDSAAERACLDTALGQAKAEIQALAAQAQQEVGSSNASIFEAHEMFLSDPELLEQVRATIETRHVNADYAWKEGTAHYAATLRSLGDEYLAARATDVEDVARRVIRILHATMQHIALEGRCFVLSCNQFAQRHDYPQDYNTSFGDDPETILSRGGSCIVNPLGQILAGPNYSEECILTAELDLADIARGKFDFDVVGHYARPDIFSLHINQHPQSPVIHNWD